MYKTHLFQNTGIINSYEPSTYKYSMKTKDGTILTELHKDNFTELSEPPDFQFSSYQPQEDEVSSNSGLEHELRHNTHFTPNRQHRPYHDHEFEYPPGTTTKTITSSRFMSSVKDCVNEHITHTINDLDTLYDNLYNRLRAHNMFLHPY